MNKKQAMALFSAIKSYDGKIEFIEKVMVPVLKKIGEKWETGELALAQVYMSGKICEQIVDKFTADKKIKPAVSPKIAIATLEDYHSLGRRIVSSVVRSAGFCLKDYGAGISADELADLAATENIDILLISVLVLPSALKVANLKGNLIKRGASAKVIVGGAPFALDDSLWIRVGADAFGCSAFDAVRLIKERSIEAGRNIA